jgi:integral membrane sensor domain MASE1
MGGRSSPGGLGLTGLGLGAGSVLNQLKNWASATGAKAIEAAASKEMPRQNRKKRLKGCPIGAWVTPIFVEI